MFFFFEVKILLKLSHSPSITKETFSQLSPLTYAFSDAELIIPLNLIFNGGHECHVVLVSAGEHGARDQGLDVDHDARVLGCDHRGVDATLDVVVITLQMMFG